MSFSTSARPHRRGAPARILAATSVLGLCLAASSGRFGDDRGFHAPGALAPALGHRERVAPGVGRPGRHAGVALAEVTRSQPEANLKVMVAGPRPPLTLRQKVPQLLGVAAAAAVLVLAVSAVATNLSLLAQGLNWVATPGHADPTFGSLCVVSNLFFAPLAAYFYSQDRPTEGTLVVLCAVASVIYHGFQVHPACGPAHVCTKHACKADVGLCSTLGLVLGRKYAVGRKSIPPLVGAALCFLLPGLIPSEFAQVGYSFLHSAWHGFSAFAAYAIAAEGRTWSQVLRLGPSLAASASVVAVRGGWCRRPSEGRRGPGLVGSATPLAWSAHLPGSVPSRPWSQ